MLNAELRAALSKTELPQAEVTKNLVSIQWVRGDTVMAISLEEGPPETVWQAGRVTGDGDPEVLGFPKAEGAVGQIVEWWQPSAKEKRDGK